MTVVMYTLLCENVAVRAVMVFRWGEFGGLVQRWVFFYGGSVSLFLSVFGGLSAYTRSVAVSGVLLVTVSFVFSVVQLRDPGNSGGRQAHGFPPYFLYYSSSAAVGYL